MSNDGVNRVDNLVDRAQELYLQRERNRYSDITKELKKISVAIP